MFLKLQINFSADGATQSESGQHPLRPKRKEKFETNRTSFQYCYTRVSMLTKSDL